MAISMTPSRAEETASKIIGQLRMASPGNGGWDGPFNKKMITEAITQAIDEVVRDKQVELFEGEDCVVAELCREAHGKGFREAIEQCANICQEKAYDLRIEAAGR